MFSNIPLKPTEKSALKNCSEWYWYWNNVIHISGWKGTG